MQNTIIYKSLKLNLSVAILALIIGSILHFFENGKALGSISMNIINFGIFLIIIAPVLRIFLELFFFIKEKNYTYIAVCILLCIIIVISIIC